MSVFSITTIPQVLRSFPMFRWTLLALLGMAAPSAAQVLDPPVLSCATVNVAGDVTLNWVVPPDPNSIFDHYEVYHSSGLGGPYTLLAPTVNVYGQTTYLHLGAGAVVGPQCYYVVTVSTAAPPNISVPSDTICTIHLDVTQSNPLGSAVLDWTPQHTPPLPGADTEYDLWMEYPIGSWQLIGQVGTDTLHYEHAISICEDSLTFRVSLANGVFCNSFSSRDGDVFQDATPPSAPVITAVSVDTATGLATITWAPSPEPDTDAYIVILSDALGNLIVDTLYGQGTTFYTYPLSNAGSMAESFTLAAFDTCWTGTPASPNTSATLPLHTTVHTSTEYNECEGVITVHWTPYVGWDVQNYEVYARQTGGSVFLLGTFNANVTSAQHADVLPFTEYCYVVKAIKSGGGVTSLSNQACRTTDYPPVPQFNYIQVATVENADHVRILDEVDPSAVASRYRLERSANGEPFEEIAAMSGFGAGPLLEFNDLDVEADQRSYSYRLIVDDSCGTQAVVSNVASTMHLRALPRLEGYNDLSWNGYGIWGGAVGAQALYRNIADGPYQQIALLPADQWSYVDPVEDQTSTNGKFCYYVEATEVGNPSGNNAVARSNVACAVQQELFWLPNAFIAGSAIAENTEFKPVTAYAGFKNYQLVIYNRWGQNIWSSTDPAIGWNGQALGAYVEQGVYGYFCTYDNGEGRRLEKRGTVTFLWGRE
ncbi:MAG: gliding motility-associated C-terminal domain-containing protein [Flavobacteriales bacterium]|nr:gliding motility-associated C-terminal domain-containing protein [Flavobacteriales bacterium]